MSPQLRHDPDLPIGAGNCVVCWIRRRTLVLVYIAIVVTVLLVLALVDL